MGEFYGIKLYLSKVIFFLNKAVKSHWSAYLLPMDHSENQIKTNPLPED